MRLFFPIFISCWLSNLSFAAPFPASSTSELTSPKKGNFLKKHGFVLKTEGTQWILSTEPEDSVFESYTYRLKKTAKDTASTQSLLSVRIDNLEKNSNLESYAKKWMKEYPQFGYEILGTRQMKFGGGTGLLVDLIQKNKSQQVRQLILSQNKNVAILTCTDEIKSFKKTLTDCNDILNSFRWNSSKD